MTDTRRVGEFYYCYSPKLHAFLQAEGQRYICVGLNEDTHRKFWQYRGTTELNALLTKWSKGRPQR